MENVEYKFNKNRDIKKKRGRPRKIQTIPEENIAKEKAEKDKEEIALDTKKVKDFEKQEVKEVFHTIELSSSCMEDISDFIRWTMNTDGYSRNDIELKLKGLIQRAIASNKNQCEIKE